MKQAAFWGLVGSIVIGGSLVAAPAQAQLSDLTKAAGKLASKLKGSDVSASTVSATTVAAPSAAADKSARVTLLDKQTNRRQVLVLIAGEAQVVGTLQVKLTKCLPDYGAVLGQDVAWLDITESAEGSGRTAPWFSGWMFSTYPEVSTLDHPRYDVQLQGCGTKVRQVVKALGSAPVLDSAPIGDTETPADGGDPYYVPGVEKKEPATEGTTGTDGAQVPVESVPVVQPEAVAEPVVDTEAPAEVQPEAVEPQAGPVPVQDDLHKMMDSGQY